MFAVIQALIAPRIAVAAAVARLTLRRAILLIAAALFGIGALVFLSVGIVFALIAAVGPAWASLIMAAIWALAAGCLLLFARMRPRVVVPRVVVPTPAAAPPPPQTPAPGAPIPPASPTADLRARIGRAAPVLAIGALIAGIVAGRR